MCRMLFIFSLLLLWYFFIPQYAHGQLQPVLRQRVINIRTSIVLNDSTVWPRDSVIFKYRSKRGSTFKPYDFYTGGLHGYYNYYHPEWFPLADLPEPIPDIYSMNVHFDTCFELVNQTSGPSYYQDRIYAGYDEQNRITSFEHLHRHISDMPTRKIVRRNAEGYPTDIYIVSVDTATGNLDTSSQRQIFYDSYHRVASDTLRHLDNTSYDKACQYTYDTDGRVTGMLELTRKPSGNTWQFGTNHVFAYNAEGMLIRYTTQQYNDILRQWEANLTTNVSYDHLGRIIGVSNNAPAASPHSYTIHYSSEGRADTFTRYTSVRNIDRTRFYYNAYGNPDSAHTYSSYDSGRTYSRLTITRYYYETYEDTGIAAPQKGILIYPNPASSKISIRWNDKRPVGEVYVILHSSSGQHVRKMYLPVTNSENTIDVRGLSSGVYYLQIITAGGGKLHTATVSINNNGS